MVFWVRILPSDFDPDSTISPSLFGTKNLKRCPLRAAGAAIVGAGRSSSHSNAFVSSSFSASPFPAPATNAWNRRAGEGGHSGSPSLPSPWKRPSWKRTEITSARDMANPSAYASSFLLASSFFASLTLNS